MPAVASSLRCADSAKVVNEARAYGSVCDKVEAMVRENVIAPFANLKTQCGSCSRKASWCCGSVYDIALAGATNCPLADHLHVCATPVQLNVAA